MTTTDLPGGVQLIIRADHPIAEVWLTRPEIRNAQTMATWESLARAAATIADHPAVSLVVVRGVGADFSAGLDLRMLRGSAPEDEGDLRDLLQRDPAAVEDAIAVFQQGFTCWRELPAVVVAAVAGNAIGAGFQLALAADLRVLADDAVFAMAEARLGLVPDLGGTQRLVDIVGYARALEMCATAAPVDAALAERLGLANAVVARDDFDAGLERYLAGLLAIDPAVSRSLKALIGSAQRSQLTAQLAAERKAQVPLIRRLNVQSGQPPGRDTTG